MKRALCPFIFASLWIAVCYAQEPPNPAEAKAVILSAEDRDKIRDLRESWKDARIARLEAEKREQDALLKVQAALQDVFRRTGCPVRETNHDPPKLVCGEGFKADKPR